MAVAPETPMQAPKVFISVLNWNNAGDTARCLKSLEALQGENFRIFAVDNHSLPDPCAALSAEFPFATLIRSEENLGYAGGHELVAKIAVQENADLLWILNNDATVFPDALQHLTGAWREQQDAVYGSAILEKKENGLVVDFPPEVIEAGQKIVVQGRPAEVLDEWTTTDTAFCHGGSIMIPVDLIRKEGFIDTTFFLYFEEYDYCKRLQAKGIPSRIALQSKVVHNASASFRKSARLKFVRTYYFERNYCRFRRQHQGYTFNGLVFSYGGWLKLLKRLRRVLLPGKKDERYYHDLAIVHAFLGIKGRTLNPDDFLD